MSRILEVVFVIGCSLVGLGMSASEGSLFHSTVKNSIQLVVAAEDNVASNAARFRTNLTRVPARILAVRP